MTAHAGRRIPVVLRAIAVALVAAAGAAGCSPRVQEAGPAIAEPMLTANAIVAPDGAHLPLRSWLPEGKPVATVLALHGFNDYSRAFELPGAAWADAGIATYAYDQRGFGGTEHTGIWAGDERLVDDLLLASALIRERHPGVPHYVLGESMGGAVVMAALGETGTPDIDGAILVAPAVWGREQQSAVAMGALWFFAHTMPWMTLTGEGLKVVPTDNGAVLREMWLDPLVLKKSRVDAIYGLVGLMDRAVASIDRLGEVPVLVLYGANEDVLPPAAVMRALERLPARPTDRLRPAIYSRGYHMLLRDLGAETVWNDIAAWISSPGDALPSGADEAARHLLANGAADLADMAEDGDAHAPRDGDGRVNPVPSLANGRG